MSKSIFKPTISKIILVLLFFSAPVFAQVDCDDPFNPNPDDPACDPDIYVPIDDGVYFILAAGVIIGYSILKKRKLESNII